jgi:hypothetical protein
MPLFTIPTLLSYSLIIITILSAATEKIGPVFCELATEMEGHSADGEQELTKFTCDAHGLMLDIVSAL